VIREWEEKDLKQINILLNQLKNDIGKKSIIEYANIQDNFDEMQKSDLYKSYVYIENQIIIGFISLLFYRTVLNKKGTVVINELVVRKEYQNKGVGRKLLESAIEEANNQNMDEIEVGVMKDNINAIKFYKKNGLNEEYYLLGKIL
jgi:ribosomal protein S18 acetylase RimI-like enzyme